MDTSLKSRGTLSLTEAYAMTFKQREYYIETFNKIEESKSGVVDPFAGFIKGI